MSNVFYCVDSYIDKTNVTCVAVSYTNGTSTITKSFTLVNNVFILQEKHTMIHKHFGVNTTRQLLHSVLFFSLLFTNSLSFRPQEPFWYLTIVYFMMHFMIETSNILKFLVLIKYSWQRRLAFKDQTILY
jgi:hypothetical protein